jgi:hypothetical protein
MKPVIALALAAMVVSAAATAATIAYDDRVGVGKPLVVTIRTHRPASFRVVLRTSTRGRTQVRLSARRAPSVGPLLDTGKTRCEGAAGSFYCRGAYEPLPPGEYTWTVRRVSGPPTPVTLTVRW